MMSLGKSKSPFSLGLLDAQDANHMRKRAVLATHLGVSKKILITISLLFLLMLSVAGVSAITARMGNSRMILYPNIGEPVEKYILVQNVNDVPLTIKLEPTGDLAENVEIEEPEFVLEPDTEKNAYFTIRADEEGTTETKINVRFIPEEGTGVGLTSTIIMITSGEYLSLDTDLDDTDLDADLDDDSSGGEDGESAPSPNRFLFVSSILLIIVFVILIVYSSHVKSSKKVKTKKKAKGSRG